MAEQDVLRDLSEHPQEAKLDASAIFEIIGVRDC
jgi:hypothetical protein